MHKHLTFLLLILLMVTVSVYSGSAQEELPIYIVRPGDTLSAIAETFGTSVDALIVINEIENPSQLFPDQELRIPGFEGVSGILETTEVLFGESLDMLAARFGVEAAHLIQLNRITNPMRLYSGQELIYPKREFQEEVDSLSIKIPKNGFDQLSISSMLGFNSWTIAGARSGALREWMLPGELIRLSEAELSETRILRDLPELTISPALQGRTLSVTVDWTDESQVAGTLDGNPLNFTEVEKGNSVALKGIHALAEPGLQVLELTIEQEDTQLDLSQPIRVFPIDYARETLSVPAETLDPAVTGPENDLIQVIVSEYSSEQLWEGSFLFPAEYYESFPSFFGTRRSYNGSAFVYYHTGLDLFGSTLTPVLAPAPGRVVLTESLIVRGNSTYIDHGWGVFSGFLHQSQILVEVGDFVEIGQVLGFVGGTGRVTGPHLHWEIWVGGVPVDPLEWTSNVFGSKPARD
jgi:murein DD-endopeptidase MepM/ murein hydrolase activator NlpD